MAKRRGPDDDPEPPSTLDGELTGGEPDPVEEPEQPAAPAPPDPWAVMAQVVAALQAIAVKLDNPTVASADTGQALMAIQERLAQTMDRLADANIQGAQIIATETKRAHRPSNEIVPGISVFNRRGTNLPHDAKGAIIDGMEVNPMKPPLKCVMLLPWLAEWESLTREEVELLNLLQPGEFILKRIDNSKVKVEVRIDYRVDGRPSRLILRHDTAFNNDNFKLVPPLNEMLRQVLKQTDPPYKQRAAAVLSDEEEEALIEAGELTTAAA